MTPENNPKPFSKGVLALLQSTMVALYMLLVFVAIYRFHSKIAIASLGASAFIAFGFPAAQSARPRFLLGGYACGILWGGACGLVLQHLPAPLSSDIRFTIGLCVLAVFLTVLSMILLNLQHPPATALCISLVCDSTPFLMGLSVFACILALCGIRYLAVRLWGHRFPKAGS